MQNRTAYLYGSLKAVLCFFCVSISIPLPVISENILSYQDAIETALSIHPETRIAAEKIKQSRFDVGIAQGALYPKLSLTAKAGREYKSPGNGRAKYDELGPATYMNSSDFLLTFEQLLFDGFTSTSEIQRKKLNWLGSYHRANLIRHKLAKSVSDVFVDMYYQVQTLNEINTFLSELEMLTEKVSISAEEGAVSRLMDKFVSSRLSFAKQSKVQAETALNDILDTYTSLTDIELDLSKGRVAIPELEPLAEYDDYYLSMLTHNPDILRKYTDFMAAKQDIRKSKGAYYPRLKILADFNETNDAGGPVGAIKYGTLMLEMKYKIFDGFVRKNTKQKTYSVLEEKERDVHRSVKKLERNLKAAWQTILAKKEEFSLVETELLDSQEVKILRQEEFQEGAGDVIQLIEAVESVHNAHVRQFSLQKELTKARYELEFLTGQSPLLTGVNLLLDDQKSPQITKAQIRKDVQKFMEQNIVPSVGVSKTAQLVTETLPMPASQKEQLFAAEGVFPGIQKPPANADILNEADAEEAVTLEKQVNSNEISLETDAKNINAPASVNKIPDFQIKTQSLQKMPPYKARLSEEKEALLQRTSPIPDVNSLALPISAESGFSATSIKLSE